MFPWEGPPVNGVNIDQWKRMLAGQRRACGERDSYAGEVAFRDWVAQVRLPGQDIEDSSRTAYDQHLRLRIHPIFGHLPINTFLNGSRSKPGRSSSASGTPPTPPVTLAISWRRSWGTPRTRAWSASTRRPGDAVAGASLSGAHRQPGGSPPGSLRCKRCCLPDGAPSSPDAMTTSSCGSSALGAVCVG